MKTCVCSWGLHPAQQESSNQDCITVAGGTKEFDGLNNATDAHVPKPLPVGLSVCMASELGTRQQLEFALACTCARGPGF